MSRMGREILLIAKERGKKAIAAKRAGAQAKN